MPVFLNLDNANLESSCTFKVIVRYGLPFNLVALVCLLLDLFMFARDVLPPVFTICPSDQTVAPDLGLPTANVSYVVDASDNVAVQSITCSNPSGSRFQLGQTMV
jgi:hypothetical protein